MKNDQTCQRITGSASEEAEVDADPERGHERLAGVKVTSCRWFFGQRQLELVDQPGVEDEADDGADRERAEADEEALSQLVEMLDERCLLAVVQTARKGLARHAA